jgi:DNA-binding IclR family transcriptional regulator
MKSLETAVSVLKTFISEDGDLSVNDVVERSGLKKSHVSKILSSLRKEGFLEQDPRTRRYSVGVDAFELGTRYIVRSQVARDALPIMRQLVDLCGHSATLSTLRGEHVLHIMAVEGPHFIDGRWRVGNRLPIHATAAGQVMLSFMDAQRRDSILAGLNLTSITGRTITDMSRFRSVLNEVAASGCSTTRGESAPGLAALAVPLLGEEGALDYALGIVLPDPLLDEEDPARIKDWLFASARRLSLKLGASAYPFGTISMEAAG